MRAALLLAVLGSACAFVVRPPISAAQLTPRCRSDVPSMAHHVQHKATKGHSKNRPKKSRPSDRNRKAPEYPAIPEQPWMKPVDSLPSSSKQTVSIAVSPSDGVAELTAKVCSACPPVHAHRSAAMKAQVEAAGAKAPNGFFYGGKALETTLGDAGLKEDATMDATV